MDVGGKRKTTCSTAGPLFVTVNDDDKIVRVEPMQFDPEEVDSWEVEKNGKVYRPPLAQAILPWGLAFKQINNSENRVNYPMKRVDWDPNGERNTQNRGISGYERISWDEALDIVEAELNRVINTYGNAALAACYGPHPEWGELHYFFSEWFRFWHGIGSTELDTTPISWEGWAAGAPFVWGFWAAMGFPPQTDTLQDITENSELIVLWGSDPLFHKAYTGIDEGRLWQYWKSLGKRIITIDPLSNEITQAAADRWIPIKSGTDGALACAILHVWITEGTYDKEYLDTHALGWDEEHLPAGAPEGSSMVSYILGKSKDGIAKTPAWASEITGIPEGTIVALAREWASKPTALYTMAGGACRRQYAHEFSRLCAVLCAAQGIGKPGVSILWGMLSLSGPYDAVNQVSPPGYADGGMNSVLQNYQINRVHQMVTVQKFPDCIENPPQKWNGGRLQNLSMDEFWADYEYPAPGCSEIHLVWQRGSSWANQADRHRHKRAFRNPKIETYIVDAPWFDRDCHYADLVLPVTTLFERQDITEPGSVGQYVPPCAVTLRSAVMHQRIVEPSGESKPDMQILSEVAERLGWNEYFMEGNTENTLIEQIYAKTNIPMEFEEFKEKGYYVWPAPKDYKPNKQMQGFYEDPTNNPLETESGLIEIFSMALYRRYGDDEEIPPVPHYIPEKEGASNAEAREKYPLLVTMAHPKFRFHGKYNDCSWLSDLYKVKGPDGYPYEPIWMNPADAEARGLEEGDIVCTYNDRGRVLGGLHVTERMTPGVIWQTYGAWDDPLDKTDDAIQREGNLNYLSNPGPMSKHHVAGAFNSVLCEVEKVDLDELREKYPEGMAGKYRSWVREA